ncbi:MAG: DNA repair protein RecO [Vicingaceae bacterium]
MLSTTKGIVIHHFKYSEKSVIAKIYTQNYGLQSYIINGVRNKKSKNKAAYLQPLSLVEIDANQKENKGLHRVKNIDLEIPFTTIPFDIKKSTIAFFIAEILYKSIKEEEANSHLYNFLNHAIQALDLVNVGAENFHILFLAHLSKHLGFYPQIDFDIETIPKYFDFQEGCFVNLLPYHKAFIEPPHSLLLFQLFSTSYDKIEHLNINKKERKTLLRALLNYYSLHLSNFDNLKTLEILEEVLN